VHFFGKLALFHPFFSEQRMKLKVAANPGLGRVPELTYSWDEQTGILGARVIRANSEWQHPGSTAGHLAATPADGIVQISAPDGAWMHLEVAKGRLEALEIAVWPDLAANRHLKPPGSPDGYANVTLEGDAGPVGTGAVLSLTTPIQAIPDKKSKTVRICFGFSRASEGAIRVADSMLLQTGKGQRLAAIWLLNVPGLGAAPPG
jgi:hypothetical protein